MYPTKEYVARDDNGEVTSTVNVYVVTEDRDGENVQTTGGIVQAHTGDVLVQGGNPNYWDILPASTWEGLGYSDASAPAPQSEPVAVDEPTPPAE